MFAAHLPPDPVELLTSELSNRSVGERGRIVRDVSALFMDHVVNYSAAHVELFDMVLMSLIKEVDQQIRIHLAESFAYVDNAPREVVRHLASDDEIKVAGPLLSFSSCLDDEFLVESARNKSQEHLLAISSRQVIGCRVTDVLVDRGNDQVVLTLAGNKGAELSATGCALIVERAKNNQDIARVIWNRDDIPRQQVLVLLAKASDAVRRKLEAEDGRRAGEVADAVKMSSQKLQEKSQESSAHYARAKSRVEALKRSGGLSESHILMFARAGEFEEVVIAISEMSHLLAGDVERMMLDEVVDRLLIVSKAIGLSWATLKQVTLLTKRPSPAKPAHWEQLEAKYRSVQREAAAKTLQFHLLRQKALGCC